MQQTNQQPLSPNLSGKIVVISGATSGIGWQAGRDFALRGARVIGIGRSASRAEQAAARIHAEIPEAQVDFVLADLSLQAEVRRAAAQIRQTLADHGIDHIDVLINNAGTFTSRRVLTEDGIERTFAVNHLAPFLLTHLLLDLLAASGDGRVLTVSSGSHYRTWILPRSVHHPRLYLSLWAYKTSKLSNVLFSYEFNRRNGARPVRAFAVDPGLVNTEIGFKHTDLLSRFVWQFRRANGTHPSVPARTMLTLADGENRYNNGRTAAPVYWKDSQPKQASRAARNARCARILWEQSCRLCGIDADWE
ncbi:MAG: SDR family NAD(P)-dependent oxidoreductase [Anaerolineaceae bacterium]|nr:SDR family NAD(P)-dependent oxidoreductase [Anaerolineaceae bacterium]